jgi:hypothetical protein
MRAAQPVSANSLCGRNGWCGSHTSGERPSHRRIDGGSEKNRFAAASLRAVIFFHAFMKAPWRYRLEKCKRCHNYFVLKVNPSKTPYVRGMHCSECMSPASAEASAKTKQAGREQQLLGLTAGVWFSWRPAPRFGERNEWVANRVNASLGRKEIQRNWVTRHEKEIIAEAKKRHGQSGGDKDRGRGNKGDMIRPRPTRSCHNTNQSQAAVRSAYRSPRYAVFPYKPIAGRLER